MSIMLPNMSTESSFFLQSSLPEAGVVDVKRRETKKLKNLKYSST